MILHLSMANRTVLHTSSTILVCWLHSPVRAISVKWQQLDWTTYELTCHIIFNTLLPVRCRLTTLQHVNFVIRLPWHFPDGGWKMLETNSWLNEFYPLQRIWCLLIDRLIPRRNRMCQDRRLMKQKEACIPQTPCLSLNSPPYVLQQWPAPTGFIFCFASLASLGPG